MSSLQYKIDYICFYFLREQYNLLFGIIINCTPIFCGDIFKIRAEFKLIQIYIELIY